MSKSVDDQNVIDFVKDFFVVTFDWGVVISDSL